jgi:hypothetical protein
MGTIYRGSRKKIFSVLIHVTSWFFSGKYQICIQHYPSGVSNPLPLMDKSALYCSTSTVWTSNYFFEAKINVNERLST